MGSKCKKCSGSVSGVEDIPYGAVAATVAAAFIAKKGNQMLTTNADGTPKTTGYLVENPKVKDALFLAAGLAATAYAGGNDMILGAGLGLASYAGMKLIEGFYSPAVSGFSAYVQPANIAGYHVSGNAYVPPANIAALKKQERIKVPVQQQVMFTPGL